MPTDNRRILRPVLLAFLAFLACVAAGNLAAGTPGVGDPAPLVKGRDQDGNPWKLAERIGKEAVFVYFYPKDDTAGCTKEARGFRDRIAGLKTIGVSVVGISRDDTDSHKKFREKNGLNFPLLVDVDGKLTEAFGASAPDRPRSRRISFLVGKDGKIAHITDKRDAQVHLDELKQAVATLNP
jgi:thioredoxin-dependent peroxiredoxin